MTRKKTIAPRFAVCVDNSDYPAALELHKIYRVLPDDRAAKDEFIRVIDESGEDYLYSADRFVPLALPRKVERSVAGQARKTTPSAGAAMPSKRAPTPVRRSRLTGWQRVDRRRG